MKLEEIKDLIDRLKDCGLNQSDIARELRVNRSSVCMWYSGAANPRDVYIMCMRRLLEDARGQQLAPVS